VIWQPPASNAYDVSRRLEARLLDAFIADLADCPEGARCRFGGIGLPFCQSCGKRFSTIGLDLIVRM